MDDRPFAVVDVADSLRNSRFNPIIVELFHKGANLDEDDLPSDTPNFGHLRHLPSRLVYGLIKGIENKGRLGELDPSKAKSWTATKAAFGIEGADYSSYCLPRLVDGAYVADIGIHDKVRVRLVADFTKTLDYYIVMFGQRPVD